MTDDTKTSTTALGTDVEAGMGLRERETAPLRVAASMEETMAEGEMTGVMTAEVEIEIM